MIAYDKGNFQEAIQLFQQMEMLPTGHRFYLALCYMEIGDTGKAISQLEQVVNDENETFYLPALWYQGLAYLSAGEVTEAEKVFLRLTEEEDSTYYTKAREILSDL